MKKIALPVLLLLFSSLAFAVASGTKASEYTLVVHVNASYLRAEPARLPQNLTVQVLEAVVDGQQMELTSQPSFDGILLPGDYPCKKMKSVSFTRDQKHYDAYLAYELLLPDGKTRNFRLTGLVSTSARPAPPR